MKKLKKWSKMLNQIKKHDKKKRENVDARNQADTIIHTTEKNLKEHGNKISRCRQESNRNRNF